MSTISYIEFKNYLKTLDYRDYEIDSLFQSVKEMDSESKEWFINWFKNGELSCAVIDGKSARLLVDEYHMTPVNAIVTLDWLKNEPEMASLFLADALTRNGTDFSAESDRNGTNSGAPETDEAYISSFSEDSISVD